MRSHRLLPTVVTALAALACAGSARAEAPQAAFLQSSDAVTDALFASVAASGSTVVAGGRVTDVFVEPATGWVSGGASAVLADPSLADGSADSVAISGDTIVARMTGAPGTEDVFTEPAAGWSGTVAPAARLVDTGALPVTGAVIEDDTIAAVSSADDAVDIFTKPSAGWTGTVTPAATLALPFGVVPDAQPAIADGAVFVPANGTTYVFSEPAGGWTGTVPPSATLDADGDVSASGATALVDGRLFTRKAAGWTGHLAPTATVLPEPQAGVGFDEIVSGTLVASVQTGPSANHCGQQDACNLTIRAATEPQVGWSGTNLAQPVAESSGNGEPLELAAAGGELYEAEGNGITVFAAPASAGQQLVAPAGLRAHATGLTDGRPALRLGLRSAAGQPAIRRLTVTLPRGLSFATPSGRLSHGVALQGAPIGRLMVGGARELTIDLKGQTPDNRGLRTLRISIGNGALRVSRSLARRLRAGGHRRRTLRVTVRATTAVTSWTVDLKVHV